MDKDKTYLGFDFGYKRIGVAVGQRLTRSASPLKTLKAQLGCPNWLELEKLLHQWRPDALVVGFPTLSDGGKQYTAKASEDFADELRRRFDCTVHMVDERLTTVEARSLLFAKGGYREIQRAELDSIAACIILEQWLLQI